MILSCTVVTIYGGENAPFSLGLLFMGGHWIGQTFGISNQQGKGEAITT